MLQKIKNALLPICALLVLFAPSIALNLQTTVYADRPCDPHCEDPGSDSFTPCTLPGKGSNAFFGFPHWWEYLQGEKDSNGVCVPHFNFPNDIWVVGFAVIDMLLYLAGVVAVISIIIAGVMYITATGNAEKATSARKRIVNSLIGLAIVISASALVSFIGNQIT